MPAYSHKLIETAWPDFGGPDLAPAFPAEDYEQRLARTRAAMLRRGLTHLVVYADREHFANMLWLTGFDPRFEEALLILRADGTPPLLLTGLECASYLPVSPPWNSGALRHEVLDEFSLPDIPPTGSRPLSAILNAEQIVSGAVAGCAGWKHYTAHGKLACDLPAYIVDALRDCCGESNVVNATSLFIDPAQGLRTFATAREIAWFEHANFLASEGMKRILLGIREGATDFDLIRRAGFSGHPLGCHWGLKTGPNRISLASPVGARVERGQPLSGNVCYRGANCCRAGWVAESDADLPAESRDYVDAFAGPYYSAMAAWFEALRIGATGADLDHAIRSRLPHEKFNIKLNAGHLTHLEEWMSSPVGPDSPIHLHSGMLFQSDVIPSSKRYYSARLEDTYALASPELQRQLAAEFPECRARCEARRAFMRNVLGLPMSDDVLPLSNLAGIAPPYLLRPEMVLAVDRD